MVMAEQVAAFTKQRQGRILKCALLFEFDGSKSEFALQFQSKEDAARAEIELDKTMTPSTFRDKKWVSPGALDLSDMETNPVEIAAILMSPGFPKLVQHVRQLFSVMQASDVASTNEAQLP
eukprot:CAMPEP_0184555644 /NCGR_PEP_ID=MMETSP0199_2-20130426/38003_1 /TAXON_ID=1112570 /ORGANISM="Thraustochytrium sp., Strain LLF1b" /LENGTH=120 /DNA_ID=CAMNT_0026952029 /DNA_START=266 /DNA_END=628 /DNA_ORIENTATION=+